MTDLEKELEEANKKIALSKEVLQEWLDKQGEEQCWYYPALFRRLCEIYGVIQSKDSNMPPQNQFEKGCARFTHELYTGIIKDE